MLYLSVSSNYICILTYVLQFIHLFYIYSPPLKCLSSWHFYTSYYSPPFCHLWQRVYIFLKTFDKNVLCWFRMFWRVLSQLSNAMSIVLIWIATSAAKWTSPWKVEILGSCFKRSVALACSFYNMSTWGVREAWILINLALMLASSVVSTTILLCVCNNVSKCCCAWEESCVSLALDACNSSSNWTICWPTSAVNGAVLHNLPYKDNILFNILVTCSSFLSNSTCDKAISVAIFSFTLPWNFLLDHSKSLTLVSRSTSYTWSTISNNWSIISLDSSSVSIENASKNISLIFWRACFCRCYFLKISCCLFLSIATCSLFKSSRVIVADSKWVIMIFSSRNGSP